MLLRKERRDNYSTDASNNQKKKIRDNRPSMFQKF